MGFMSLKNLISCGKSDMGINLFLLRFVEINNKKQNVFINIENKKSTRKCLWCIKIIWKYLQIHTFYMTNIFINH